MRRRRPEDARELPARFRIYDPADWPGMSYQDWRLHRMEWMRENGFNPLNVLLQERAARLAGLGIPDLSRRNNGRRRTEG